MCDVFKLFLEKIIDSLTVDSTLTGVCEIKHSGSFSKLITQTRKKILAQTHKIVNQNAIEKWYKIEIKNKLYMYDFL